MSDTPSQAGLGNGVAPAKPNGAPHVPHAAAAVQERHTDQSESPRTSRRRPKGHGQRLKLAPFAAVEVEAAGAQMWPVHSVAWFHPELKPRLPDSAGLTIEHYRSLPAPDFLRLEVTPADQAHSADEVCDPLAPDLKPRLPASGLAPSGWDPRAAVASVRNASLARTNERGKS